MKKHKFTYSLLELFKEKIYRKKYGYVSLNRRVRAYSKLVAQWNQIPEKSFHAFDGIKFISECEDLSKKLFTNACGDFTLMYKNNWFKLRGYVEFEKYFGLHPRHLDSILLLSAYYAKLLTQVLDFPIYHIDHGSTTVSFKENELEEKMRNQSLDCLEWFHLETWGHWMQQHKRFLFFASDYWGLSQNKLKESDPKTMQKSFVGEMP